MLNKNNIPCQPNRLKSTRIDSFQNLHNLDKNGKLIRFMKLLIKDLNIVFQDRKMMRYGSREDGNNNPTSAEFLYTGMKNNLEDFTHI
jgi:hypothetical protein